MRSKCIVPAHFRKSPADVWTGMGIWINDHESVAHKGEQKEMLSAKGVIFHLASGNEISFETGTWFSEVITIRRGDELVKQFTPIGGFSRNGKTAKAIPRTVPVRS